MYYQTILGVVAKITLLKKHKLLEIGMEAN